jgi:FlaA1/EpsC-like NDP-sugar epimerase
MIILNRRLAVIIHDLFMASIAWVIAWFARFNFSFPFPEWEVCVFTLPCIIIIQGIIFSRFHLYRGLWRFASLPDLWNIFRSAFLGALLITLALFILFRLEGVPRSVLMMYPVFLIFLLGGPRLGFRLWKDHSLDIRSISKGQRVLVIGAGRAGEMMIREMLRDGNYNPVGFLDDNPALNKTEIHGVRVLGPVNLLPDIVRRHDIESIVIAIPSANDEQMQEVIGYCEQTDVPMRTLPKLQEMVSGTPGLNELREVSIEDLLGREKVELDWKIIQAGITNKTILVSGGGGSIGSELCRQISQIAPAALVILEISESNLYQIQRKLVSEFPELKLHCLLGDVADKNTVDHVLSEYSPAVIFHAAAYKHVPILEDQAREAVQNNIFGTRVLAEGADRHGCEKFVLISTDKAVNPANVLGMSKRVAEMCCETMNRRSSTAFIIVRFGNVLGSDGSVVPLFNEQIRMGGPLTVTHPEVTRYFMTIPEACQLIMQSGAMGKGGEIFVLDMGSPIRITYLAEQMIRLSGRVPGKEIDIQYIGLRAGEKLYEELFHGDEQQETTSHEKILLARHPEVDEQSLETVISRLKNACDSFDEQMIKDLLEELVPRHGFTEENTNNVIPIKKEKQGN